MSETQRPEWPQTSQKSLIPHRERAADPARRAATPRTHAAGTVPRAIPEAQPHAVRLVVDDDLKRSRLTVFFRPILAIPHLLWYPSGDTAGFPVPVIVTGSRS